MKSPIVKINAIVDRALAGQLVREARTNANLAQKFVARSLKWSPSYLCDLEDGRRDWTPEKYKLVMDLIKNNSKMKNEADNKKIRPTYE